jgi:MFS superfamily sulfate permease-like transporter
MDQFKKAISDLPASFVVFLVALPLCMGIAIASGVPPALGLVTGIIGGVVTGLLAGAPLQVSGPAAGLTVLVYQVVSEFGLAALGPVVFLCGVLQGAAGSAKLGQWFRAVSPSVIYGMLSGIGVLIISSQIHIAFDSKPGGSPLENISLIPTVIESLLRDSSMATAGAIALFTLITMVVWDKFKPASLKMLPAPLIAVASATAGALVFKLQIDFVTIPTSFVSTLNIPSWTEWSLLKNSAFLTAAVGLAVIASAETLLCASALKKMKADAEVGYNKELIAQGVGNALCGLVGALPMTGVIVRSSANIGANAKTRWSSVFHGLWLLTFVLLLPQALGYIPMAALAAILIYTGFKLVNPSVVKSLSEYGRPAVTIYFATVFGIVFTDLLTGVLIGVGLSFARLLLTFSKIEIGIEKEDESRHQMTLKGAATFLTLPKLAQSLESIPLSHKISIHFDKIFYIDHACMDLIESQRIQRAKAGGLLDIDSSKLKNSWKNSEMGTIAYSQLQQTIPSIPELPNAAAKMILKKKIKPNVTDSLPLGTNVKNVNEDSLEVKSQ